MSGKQDMYYSILIVSSSDRFNSLIKKYLHGFTTIDIKKSAAVARRNILERYYDIIVIHAPLQDESGIELAFDASEKCNASILFVTPTEVYDDVLENVTDKGILSITKDMIDTRLDQAIRYLVAAQARVHRLEQKNLNLEEKVKEARVVGKAKGILISKKGMSEDEAHRYIGKQAMDNGVSRKRIAEDIIDEYG
ncbi:MAG: ANTAR domain-containing protein [Lachnospiraceae bacterium]|nr:ANTAR domain-containing protein [Lachnospiraceae bacterium]